MKESEVREVIEKRYYDAKAHYKELTEMINADNYNTLRASRMRLNAEKYAYASLYKELFGDKKLLDDYYPKYVPYTAPK